MLQLCVFRDIEHLGSLESTQEARVALGAYTSFVSLLTFLVLNIEIRTLTQEFIVNHG